ncbi:retrovirus-related pol polyprotein from transposon tnt 1-94, partial [Lasius niger]
MSVTGFRIEPLKKDNYDTWKIQVRALLIKNDGWGYVDGTTVKPATGADAIAAWISADSKAMFDLILSIAPEELKHIKCCMTSKEVWDKLKTTYESQGPVRKAMLLKRLIQRKMEDGEDMRTHLADFFDVVGKLEDMELNIDKELISIFLLYSIPDCYEPFRVAIEAKDKILEPETLKVKMIEEYESRMRRNDGSATSAMFASRNKAAKSKRHNPNSA